MTDKEDVSQAISIEVNAILKKGWTFHQKDDGAMVVTGPGGPGPDFSNEMWRIARFVAYDDFVSIERQGEVGRSYKVTSRSRSGLEFELLIRARN